MLMKHIATPQALINTKDYLISLKDVPRSEEDQAAYEDEVEENTLALSKFGDIEMTADEEAEFLAGQSASQATQDTSDLRSAAQNALDSSDRVALRCVKAGVAFPAEWVSYVAELRAIVSSGNGILPMQPGYPAGS